MNMREALEDAALRLERAAESFPEEERAEALMMVRRYREVLAIEGEFAVDAGNPRSRKLGKTQKHALHMLIRNEGVWHYGKAWRFDSPSVMAKVYAGLEQKGLVRQVGMYGPYPRYEVTQLGTEYEEDVAWLDSRVG